MVCLDHVHYPHLIDSILSFVTSDSTVAAFRLTSHYFCRKIDAVLARHFVLRDDDERSVWISTRRIDTASPFLQSYHRLIHSLSFNLVKGYTRVTIPQVSYLEHARFLDIDCASYDQDSLSSRLPILDVVRVFRASGVPPAARTAVLFWCTFIDVITAQLSPKHLQRLIVRPYSLSQDVSQSYISLPTVEWTQPVDLQSLVFIGGMADVDYLARIISMTRRMGRIDCITLVDCADCLILSDVLDMVKSEILDDDDDDELGEDDHDWWILHRTKWQSLSAEEYGKTLTVEERSHFSTTRALASWKVTWMQPCAGNMAPMMNQKTRTRTFTSMPTTTVDRHVMATASSMHRSRNNSQ